ncbi:MAG: calcium-binding protein, partial [Phenylobacterium sp.]
MVQHLQSTEGTAGAVPEGQVLVAPGPGSVVVGGAGADTIVASQGGDTLSGGDGPDVFVLLKLPWVAHQITDFTPGTDKLDVRALLRPGGDLAGLPTPLDGYFSFVSDGHDGAVIWSNANIGAELFHLDHVAPTQLSMSDWIFGDVGQTLVGSGLSDDLAGTSLDDRLFGNSGSDTLSGDAGQDYLRGDDGNDVIRGGADFDDINGNIGDDTISGELG